MRVFTDITLIGFILVLIGNFLELHKKTNQNRKLILFIAKNLNIEIPEELKKE